jgi:hemerythrin
VEDSTPVIEWDSSYELGVQTIDDHHRELIDLLNKSYDLLLYSTDEEGMQFILYELAEYADYHFDAEERLMTEVSYKGLMPHVDKHNDFKNQINFLMRDYLSSSPNVNTDIILFLSGWLKKHILKDDRKFTVYLSKSNYPSTTESPLVF